MAANKKKRTKERSASAMNAFKKYALAEGVDLGTLGFVPDSGAGLVTLSVRAMAVFEGFAMFVVEGMGNAVSTAQQYGTSVRTQINQDTGIDVKLGMDWPRLTRLFATLKKVYPQKKKVRKPLLQQDLLRIRCNLDFNKREHTMYWAVLLLNFFGVNRGGDILPQTQKGFDPSCDGCRGDVTMESQELMMLDLRETKTGCKAESFECKPYLRDHGNPLCPVTAFEAYVALDPLAQGEDAMATPLFRHANKKAVSTRDMYDFVKGQVRRAGLKPEEYGQHSIRIGGATAALSSPSGDKYTVKVMGYWLGDSVALYTRPTRDMVVALQREMMRCHHTSMIEA
jgi:hypothetical protein